MSDAQLLMTPAGVRVGAVLLWINGLGFGLPCLPAIRNLMQGRDIPYLFGFPAYGRGPFERWGLKTTVPLLLGFLAANIGLVVAGALLWNGARSGAVLSFALLPFAAAYWLGFALPFGPVLAVASAILVLTGWSDLH